MRNHHLTKPRWLVLATLGAFATIVPSASADTTFPVWSCRASAAYVELPAVLGTTRAEPVLANGFPSTVDPDSDQCASTDSGVQNVSLLPAQGGAAGTPPLIELNGAYARTRLNPEIAAARDQDVLSQGGVLGSLRIVVGGLTIQVDAATATAMGDCTGNPATTPTFTGTSTFVNLRIGGLVIPIAENGQPIIPLDLLPLVRVSLNQQVRAGTPGSFDQSLTQRAVVIELLGTGVAPPLATVVIGEAKADRHGSVCAAAPPAPTCPAGFDPVAGSSPLLCSRTNTITREVLAPCPQGSTSNAGGACIAPLAACPVGSTRDPKTTACVAIIERPCPTGAVADPATRVCVVRATTTGASDRENGRIGSLDGPIATCGRISMRFVRGKRNLGSSMTSRFGTRTVTRGRLVTCGANPRPIVGARVDVVHVLPGDKRRRKTGLRSRLNGLLTLILPIDLRSRRVEYAYRPDLTSTRVTSRRTLTLTVKNRAGRVLR